MSFYPNINPQSLPLVQARFFSSNPSSPDDSEEAAKIGAKEFLNQVKDQLIDEVHKVEQW